MVRIIARPVEAIEEGVLEGRLFGGGQCCGDYQALPSSTALVVATGVFCWPVAVRAVVFVTEYFRAV